MISLINFLADGWLEYFSYAIVQNTIFLCFIFLALHLLRNADARMKYGVSLLGVLKLLIPPFLPGSFGSAPTSTASMAIIPEFTVTPVHLMTPRLTSFGVLLLLWSATFLIYAALSLLSTLRLKWRIRNASFMKIIIIDSASFKLLQTPSISVPMSIGFHPRRIYVPETWSALKAEQQESLLRHEVAHIQRWDGLFHSLQVIEQAIYFFHPLVWLLNERINEYREMACDDLAVERSNVTPLAYSRYLVHVAENMLPAWSYSSASALIKQRNKLYHRVNYLVKENQKMKIISRKKSWLMWCVIILLSMPLSWYCKSSEAPPLPPSVVDEVQSESTALVGKIWGQVIDEKSGEPLPGANVLLVGTTKGAATDQDGKFFILNVPPGVYELSCSFIGYGTVLIKNVKVAVNQSTQQVFKLEPQKIQGQTLRVYATDSDPSTEEVFVAYDEAPQPVGGWAAVQKNLVYPELARKAGVEGRVTVSVHIDTEGNVVETKIEKSLGDNGCDEAAVAAIKSAKWTPAKQRGKSVAVWVTLPVEFKLH